jgi:hypothetical protein
VGREDAISAWLHASVRNACSELRADRRGLVDET